MGQRLVANIYQNKDQHRPIMSIYYHWSAYTIPALIEGYKIIDCYKNRRKEYLPLIPSLIMSLETIGIRIDPDDRDYMEINYAKYKFDREKINRNNGLVAVTEEQIMEQRLFAEGEINVYLEEEEIYNYCIECFEDIESYKTWYEYDEVDLPLLLIDVEHVHYNELPAILNTLNNNDKYKNHYAFQLKDESVVQFIS